MLKFETLDKEGRCIFEMNGNVNEIGTEAAYMMSLIYRDMYRADPAAAKTFREIILDTINRAYDVIERGDL